MPRANKYFLPEYIYHITHRCHDKDYLLKFSYEKKRYLYWLKRCVEKLSLKVINYCITDNHIHLLIHPKTDGQVIAKSMQLIAGRVAQEYNERKSRTGAFWEDRYHATAVQSQNHLLTCMIYIDLNMVRAGVVKSPAQWEYCGYNDLLNKNKNVIIDLKTVCESTGFTSWDEFFTSYKSRLTAAMADPLPKRDQSWSNSIAIGDENFIREFKATLGFRGKYRSVVMDECFEPKNILQESVAPYGSFLSEDQSVEIENNSFYWDVDW